MKKMLISLFILMFVFVSACDNTEIKEPVQNKVDLPEGYNLDSYTVEEITDVSCEEHSDCETPMDYMIRSNCPYMSLCIDKKCNVVCPHYLEDHYIYSEPPKLPEPRLFEFSGKIIKMTNEIDGSILTVQNDKETREVLASIPNLGPEYASAFKNLEVGNEIQVIGELLKLSGSERIIASRLFVEGVFTGEHPCNLEPVSGSCKANFKRYYFDKEEQKCKEFLWGGCDGVVPFDLLEVCQSTCENNKAIPEKSSLTPAFCEIEGGRIVDTSDSCAIEEINIGDVEDENCSCICCMASGG